MWKTGGTVTTFKITFNTYYCRRKLCCGTCEWHWMSLLPDLIPLLRLAMDGIALHCIALPSMISY